MNPTIQEQSKAREERAKSILQKGSPETLDEYTYLVPSQFSDKKYKVIQATMRRNKPLLQTHQSNNPLREDQSNLRHREQPNKERTLPHQYPI